MYFLLHNQDISLRAKAVFSGISNNFMIKYISKKPNSIANRDAYGAIHVRVSTIQS